MDIKNKYKGLCLGPQKISFWKAKVIIKQENRVIQNWKPKWIDKCKIKYAALIWNQAEKSNQTYFPCRVSPI